MKIWYWVKEGLQITITVFAAALVYSGLMATSLTEGGSDLLSTGGLYLAIMGVIMALMCNLSLYQLHVPLTLGFGASRKSVAVGLHIFRLVLMVPVLIAVWLVFTAMDDGFVVAPWFLTTLAAAAFFICNGLGSLMGILSPKLGKGAITAMSVALMLLALLLVGLMVLFTILFADINTWLVWVIWGASALVYAVCSIAEYRAIRRFCVK